MLERLWLPRGFEFLCGLPENKRKERILVPTTAFVDDSGGKGQGHVLVLAAVSGDAEMWAEFSNEWEKRLRSSPRIEYFKMSEATGLSGEFLHVRPEAAKEKVQLLASLIDRLPIRATYSVVHLRSFEMLITRRLADGSRDAFREPYLWALHHLATALAADALERGEHHQIEMIVDNHDQMKGPAKAFYGALRDALVASQPELRMVLPADLWFRDDRDFLPLQAADMLAGEWRRAAEGVDTGPWLCPNVAISARSTMFGGEPLRQDIDAAIKFVASIPDDVI